MPTRAKLKTAAEARAELHRRGQSVAGFARQHGVPAYAVYQVLSGGKKGLRGHAHNAAVALGMKQGRVQPKGTRT